MIQRLYLKINNKTEEFLINPESKACEKVIHNLLDFWKPEDWWIE